MLERDVSAHTVSSIQMSQFAMSLNVILRRTRILQLIILEPFKADPDACPLNMLAVVFHCACAHFPSAPPPRMQSSDRVHTIADDNDATTSDDLRRNLRLRYDVVK